MIPINKILILNSHCFKWIIRKNVWKFNLETIAMIIMFWYSYILDVQILSTHKLKVSSTFGLKIDDIKNEISFNYPIDNRNGNKK